MTILSEAMSGVGRRAVLIGASVAMLAAAVPAWAQDISGELVILQWETGTTGKMWKDVEAKFMELHPDVTVREFIPAGLQGDQRGGIRTALLSGEVVDVMLNTWPAFRAELADAGILRPVDDQWASYGWDSKLSQSWRDLGSIDGTTYGVTYTYGDRSAIWYKTAQMEKAEITETPKTWEEFLASFDKLKAAGYPAPVVIPAKYWAHTEWFETLLLRTAGVDTASQLAKHEIPWTDPKVKAALMKYAEMLNAGCCAPPATMLATEQPFPTLYTADQLHAVRHVEQ